MLQKTMDIKHIVSGDGFGPVLLLCLAGSLRILFPILHKCHQESLGPAVLASHEENIHSGSFFQHAYILDVV
jgi:hypothetical protein